MVKQAMGITDIVKENYTTDANSRNNTQPLIKSNNSRSLSPKNSL